MSLMQTADHGMQNPHNPIWRSNVVIVGAGMSGILGAFLIKKRHPLANVVVVERSGQAGGPFRGIDLPGFGYCDRAMRLIYETGISELDAILHGILPENEWHVMPDNVKDVAGIYWRGELQTHSSYLDLRRLPRSVYRQCEREILQCAGNGKHVSPAANAALYLKRRFGPTTASFLASVLQKFYGLSASALHESATCQPAMNRVVLYDEDQMRLVLQDEKLRAVIAWPDQLTFPLKRQTPQSGLYPRRFGMTRVIDAAVTQLVQMGVHFLFNRRVASLEINGNNVCAVNLDDGTVIHAPALLINANGLHASLGMLQGPGLSPSAEAAQPRCWMVFLRTLERPSMGGLYYLWCFDETFHTFRVTNYANYCPDARTGEGYPLCVELWSADPRPQQAVARAIEELRRMNVIGQQPITAHAAVQGANLHALCTLDYIERLRAVREEVQQRSPSNMLTVGPFVQEGSMLLYDVARTMHAMLAERMVSVSTPMPAPMDAAA
jgi:protoporphyrinogen oxidase